MRRRELLALLAVACGKAAAHPRRGLLGSMERWNEGFQKKLFSPGSRARAPRADTPEDAFPTYMIAASVPIAPAGWRLAVGGAIDRPATFSLEELQRMPRLDLRVEHHCVEGWSATASWHGVPLAELARIVGAHRVPFVEFRSFDVDPSGVAYWSSWDRESALHPQTILAWGMNGRDLAPGHGAPLRLYSPTKLGYKNVKYLTAVNFLPEQTAGYWEKLGYEWYAGT